MRWHRTRRDQLPSVRFVLELIAKSDELIDHALQNESRRGNVSLTSDDLLIDQLIERLGYSLYSYEVRFGIVVTQDAMEFRNERDDLRLCTHELIDQIVVILKFIAEIPFQISFDEVGHDIVGLLVR